LVWSLASSKRRKRLAEAAAESRRDAGLVKAAWSAVILYNIVGGLDIASTWISIDNGAGEEINPVLRAAMDHFGPGWIAAKLILQAVISFMVLWFPHRVVLLMFVTAIAFNAGIVWSNFRIAGIV
jgi:hypothetical protein